MPTSNISKEADALRRAYQVFDLEAGASLKSIQDKFHLLTHVWHPDRLPANMQQQGTQKMKEIIESRDLLVQHCTSSRQTHSAQSSAGTNSGQYNSESRGTAGSTNQPHTEIIEWHVKGCRSDEELLTQLASPKLQRLQRLNISNFAGTDQGVATAAVKLKSLKHLDLHECFNVTDALLLELVDCASLKMLCIRGTRITSECAKEFARTRPDCMVQYGRRRSCP